MIGFLFGRAFLACGFLLRATAEGHPRTTDEPPWRFGGPLLIFYLVYALMAATRGGFAVILTRDALGDLPGEPPRQNRGGGERPSSGESSSEPSLSRWG